ncbi:hypothetical protein TNCV_4886401 [Trichonephila clavipes]|uniref:Uncharacterized protein n=1 Tax=Trichonephila clavipes TaxID=2585209 RepID=A0A8X6V792_TRICX|nr:hypothetical protein TNCV_4886401 [Trichonephila clavipes]
MIEKPVELKVLTLAWIGSGEGVPAEVSYSSLDRGSESRGSLRSEKTSSIQNKKESTYKFRRPPETVLDILETLKSIKAHEKNGVSQTS